MEENLWPKEPLVSDVDGEGLLGDGVDAVELLDVFCWILVELVELFGDVWTDVAVPLLDGLSRLQRLLRRDADLALAQQRLDEASDVATGDWNVLDAGTYHIAFRLKDDAPIDEIRIVIKESNQQLVIDHSHGHRSR